MHRRVSANAITKSLRQRKQIGKLRHTQLARSAPTPAVGGSSTSVVENGKTTSAVTSGPVGAHNIPIFSTTDSAALVGDKVLQKALLGRVADSKLQRDLRTAMQCASRKDDVVDAFLLMARTSGEAVTTKTLRSLSSSLVKLQASEYMGGAEVYKTALCSAVGSSEERWRDVTPAEEHDFAVYQCRQLERYAERGTSYNRALCMTLEGADNNAVSLMEYQMLRHGKERLPVPTDVLADMMHLDISWSAALRLYDHDRQSHSTLPPVEMSDRLMQLMVGYKSNGLGSRPWQAALQLYEKVLSSGYETSLATHTYALDALWRGGDCFHELHNRLSPAHRRNIWELALSICSSVQRMEHLSISGDDGCAYLEGVVKAVSAAGRWEAAVSVLASMDTTEEETSYRLLVPTPESYAFAMAACHVAGHASHGEALRGLFEGHYTMRSLHSEVLAIYLQSLRHVVRTRKSIGAQVEELICDGHGLDRPCAIACLQLLTSHWLSTRESKTVLAEQVWRYYDHNPWPQQPLVRKIELQTIFRCCYLLDTMEVRHGGQRSLVPMLQRYMTDLFGPSSPEMEWLEDTEVYALQAVTSWSEALKIYQRQVLDRPPDKMKYLPVPVRQVKHMLVAALLRSCRGTSGGTDDDFLLDDDTREAGRAEAYAIAQRAVELIPIIYSCDEVVPRELVAELLLVQAAHSPTTTEKTACTAGAMRELALTSAEFVTPRLLDIISHALGLTELHVESALVDGHARLRCTSLVAMSSTCPVGSGPLECVYM